MKTNIQRFAILSALLCAVNVSILPAAENAGTLLGSPEFKPMPDHPVGWRGDWTGRYSGATPPLNWSRRVKGVTSEIKIQAAKPKGEPGADAQPLEYFTIKDWLVAGPFSVTDPEKDLDKDFLGGEENVQPAEGDKAGECIWKHHRANEETQVRKTCNFGGEEFRVDYLYLYGKYSHDVRYPKLEEEPKNKAAYAHTYIHAPRESDLGLLITCDAVGIKAWLNGKPLELPKQRGFGVSCHLNKGWNRLLVKSTCDKTSQQRNPSEGWVSKWRFAAYLTPSVSRRDRYETPLTYETRNIGWMTKLTGQSMSQPTVLGDRLFLGSSTTDLLCINKLSGKILWMKTITPWDLMPEAERSAVKDRVEPGLNELNRLNGEVIKLINKGVSPQGMDNKEYDEVVDLLIEKSKAEKKLHDEFIAVDSKKYPPLYLNEVSSSIATVATDGSRLYWCCGGTKSFAVLCFDPDGNIIWTRRGIPEISPTNTVKTRINEHGTHASPLYIDGKIVYLGQSDLIGLNANDGALLWRVDGNSCGNSPIPARVGKEWAVLARGGRSLYKVSDGTTICSYPVRKGDTDCTPIIEGQTIVFSEPCTVAAFPSGGGSKGEILWKLEESEMAGPFLDESYFIASPLCVKGLFYLLSNSGRLMVVDSAARKPVYHRWLDGYNRYHRHLYGACSSPALGGKNIYITDNSGYTTVLEPGREFKVLARNVLENATRGGGIGSAGPCRQEAFYAAPTFDGGSIYLRGSDYLYCIRENGRQ